LLRFLVNIKMNSKFLFGLKNLFVSVLLVLLIFNAQPLKGQASYPDTIVPSRFWTVAGLEAGGYVAALSFLQFIWYKDHERVPFHFYNDLPGYFQIDKLGHAYTAYYESYASYHALRWSGLEKKKAIWYGGVAGLLFQTPIEVFDGLYEGWGFSWTDMIANTTGAVLFTLQEAFFDEQILRFKFSYSPSGYPKYHSRLGTTPVESFFLDYNGHSYWLSLNLQSSTGIRNIPPWLNIAVGYSINGVIKDFANPTTYNGEPFPHLERYRQFVLSMDIDWTKIETDRKWMRSLFNTLNLIKLPFPALEYNRVVGLKAHWIYF
jgi:VanZ family protein